MSAMYVATRPNGELVPSEWGGALASRSIDAVAEACFGTECLVAKYTPAPTWRPIAELPEEWRDGRQVRLGCSQDHNEYLCSWCHGIAADEPRDPGWYIWDGDDWTVLRVVPTLYLDLYIPEVPR